MNCTDGPLSQLEICRGVTSFTVPTSDLSLEQIHQDFVDSLLNTESGQTILSISDRVQLEGGECQPVNFDIEFLNTNQEMDIHCQLISSSGVIIGPIMIIVFSFMAARIVLSA
jgi:hypothetical protein